VTVEANAAPPEDAPLPARDPVPAAGRTAAWLAKQVELGVAEADLSMPQYRILGLLDAGPAMPSALADRLAVRPPSVTSVVDGLVARGLVDRHPAADDRRQVAHTLTTEGRRALTAADQAVDTRLRRLAAALDDPVAERSALEGLALWQRAMRATLAARSGAAGARPGGG
jgi:long-chain acyl-CoA synthetase